MDLLQPRGGGDPLIIADFVPAPYTTPALTANLVFRVSLALIGNIVCLVPLRLLWRNSELAAVVFIVNIELKNFSTILYALVWRNDDMEDWWPGYGLCDAGAFFHNFSIGLFTTCLLAIMRNLAHQVGLMRAHPLTTREKRKRNLVQCLIMFPLPLIMLGFTWFLTSQRYMVGALVGCNWVGYGAWPFLVFFMVAPVAVSMITVGYAVLCYCRFRQVAKATQAALSSNRTAIARAQRARRRLHQMVLSILVPYFPIMIAIAIANGLAMEGLKPFDYNKIHNNATPFPWNSILYLRSDQLDFVVLNNCYISILTTIPIFLFFGMTKDAINDYRCIALKLGLGRLWPGLYEEYDPDRSTQSGSGSFGSTSSQEGTAQSTSGYMSLKFKATTSTNPLSTISSNNSDTIQPVQSLNFLTQPSQEAGLSTVHPLRAHSTTSTVHEDTRAPQRPQPSYDTTIHRNPFLTRAHMDFSSFKLPFCRFSKPSQPQPLPSSPCATQPNHPYPLQTLQPANSHGIHTRVWSIEEEACPPHSHAESARQSSEYGVHIQTDVTRDCTRRPQR